MSRTYHLHTEGENFEVQIEEKDASTYVVHLGKSSHQFELLLDKKPIYTFLLDQFKIIDLEAQVKDDKCQLVLGHIPYSLKIIDPLKAHDGDAYGDEGSGIIEAPMAGKVIELKLNVGDSVTKGAVALIVEAMKMQNEINCPLDGMVKNIHVKVGDSVEAGQKLIEIEK